MHRTTISAVGEAGDWYSPLFVRDLKPFIRPAGAGTVFYIEGDKSASTITDQFKANAQDYHLRYSASDHFEELFRNALDATGVRHAAEPLILDVGSGSGVNSIVPCLELFPGARQVATDLSPELLGILAQHLDGTAAEARVVCVVMDAMGDELQPGTFDLVTGASILHHLVQPELGIRAAGRALKPGGHAIFFEPFDGYGLMRLAYERILAEAELRRDTLDPSIDRALRGMVADIAFRTQPAPNAAEFANMDDKWLFSKFYIEAYARAAGFEGISFVPHNDHATLYRDTASIQIRLSTGLDTPLPQWAIAILDSFDAAISLQMKRLNMLEGTIVLTMGESGDRLGRAGR